MKYSKEILAFKYHVEDHTGLYVESVIEESHLPHWKRLVFMNLTCDDLIKLGKYIKTWFSEKGTYKHLSPTLNDYKGNLCLTVDVKEINEHIIKNDN